MSKDTLANELETAFERDEPFGPASAEESLREVPAATLSQVILSFCNTAEGGGRLILRRLRIAGDLDLEAQHICLRLRLTNCELTGDLKLRQARAIDVSLVECVLDGELQANQIDLQWNLRLDHSTVHNGVSLLGARIRGQLSMEKTTLEGPVREREAAGSALKADGIDVSGGMFCKGMSSTGEVRLAGAKIGTQVMMGEATFKGPMGKYGPAGTAFNAEGIEVHGDIFWDGMSSEGEVRLLGAKIDGQLSIDAATLKGSAGEHGPVGTAFNADGIQVRGGMFCRTTSFEGGVRLPHAEIDVQVTMNKAILKGPAGEHGPVGSAFNADGIQVRGSIFLDEISCEGKLGLLGAQIGLQLSMSEATLKGPVEKYKTVGTAFNADGIEVHGDLFWDKMSAEGEVRLLGAKVDGQLAIVGARLNPGVSKGNCLSLIAGEIDELILGFRTVEGIVDLTDTKTRSLWDAQKGKFAGELPKTLKLQGFRYESLREPLTAKQRLRWIECSQGQQHSPGVYAELAEAYRRIGRRSEARAIGIANERRAREDGTLIKKAWSYLLWKSVRYGYENWRAVVGLLAVIAIGSLLFCIGENHFVATVREPPDLSSVIYATDAAIPVLDLGSTKTRVADGWLEWVELILAISGYALVAAVIAGLAGIFNRDQV